MGCLKNSQNIKYEVFMIKEKIILESGDVYEGDIVDGVPNGYGRLIFKDGSIHEGNIKNGVFYGKGKFIEVDGKVFDCNYINGKPEFDEEYYNSLEGDVSKEEVEQLLKILNG